MPQNSGIITFKYRFGSSRRKHPGNNAKVPGPGLYEHKGIVGNEGAKFTLVGRKNNSKLSLNVPAPNAYINTERVLSHAPNCV